MNLWLIAIVFFYGSTPYDANMAEDRTPQDADKYIVRFPDGMRDQLKNAAKSNNRTLNAEIVARLQDSFYVPRADELDGAMTKIISETITRTMRQMYESGWRLGSEEAPREQLDSIGAARQEAAMAEVKERREELYKSQASKPRATKKPPAKKSA